MIVYTLIAGSFLVIISSSWPVLWLGLEINIFSFVLFLSRSSAIKYFLIQVVASLLLIWGAIYSFWILRIAILIKLAAAPFHSWFIQVIKQTNRILFFLLLTWQKFAPLILLLRFRSFYLVTVMTVFRAGIGSLIGIQQNEISVLLGYSAIHHTGWLLIIRIYSFLYTIVYFIVYRIMLVPISSFTLGQTLLDYVSKFSIGWGLIIFLSLAGLPPLLGFIPKIIVIVICQSPVLYFLIFTSSITLFFYSKVAFRGLISKATKFYFLVMALFFFPLTAYCGSLFKTLTCGVKDFSNSVVAE